MSVIWSGITEEGAVVPVQVDSTGRVIAIGKDEGLDYWEKEGAILKPSDGESLVVEGTISSSVGFSGPTASFTEDITIHGLTVGLGGNSQLDNTALGQGALYSNTEGNNNTAVGLRALYNNTTGNENTALGQNALDNNTEGKYNTAVGRRALSNNTTGNENTAVGQNALYSNTTGSENTAVGQGSLYNNAEGKYNTAVGRRALYNNTTGRNNTALGQNALWNNTTGNENTAVGLRALYNNTEGNENTAVGLRALYNKTTGNNNTAVGQNALYNNTTGNNNTFIGQNPGIDGLNDTVVISAGVLERLWIDSKGQAGIGTNNPQAKLDVAGPVLFSDGLCGFLATGELFFASRNASWKLVVSSGGLVTAEELPSEFLRLNEREQHVIPPVIETNIDDGLSGPSMDIDNSSLN